MTDVLVREVFRHENGRIAEFIPVVITARNSATHLHDLITDDVGTISIYLAPGSYDWLVEGMRTPFDVLNPAVAPGADEFIHTQGAPAATWTIPHNLNRKPDAVLFTDSDGDQRVYTDTTYPSLNVMVVEWPSPETGVAYIK